MGKPVEEPETETLLAQWDIPENIIKNFKDNLIDMESFKLLYKRKKLLAELNSPIGIRLKFEKLLADWPSEKELAEMLTESVSLSSKDISSFESPKMQEVPQDVPGPSYEESNFIDENSATIITAGNKPTTSIKLADNSIFLLKETLPDFDIKTLLMATCMKKSILTFYEKYQKLDKCHQQRLVKIMIGHIYNYIVKYALENADYKWLMAKIIAFFPNETVGVYYVPATEKADSPLGISEKRRKKLPNAMLRRMKINLS